MYVLKITNISLSVEFHKSVWIKNKIHHHGTVFVLSFCHAAYFRTQLLKTLV